jgi:hypothetical protein
MPVTSSDTLTPRPAAISFSPSQNAGSREIEVLRTSTLIVRLSEDICLPPGGGLYDQPRSPARGPNASTIRFRDACCRQGTAKTHPSSYDDGAATFSPFVAASRSSTTTSAKSPGRGWARALSLSCQKKTGKPMTTSQEQADVCLKLVNEAKHWYVRMALLQLTAIESQGAGKQRLELANRTNKLYAKNAVRELAQKLKRQARHTASGDRRMIPWEKPPTN